MHIYCQDRLQNIENNINAILARFKQIKPKKKADKNAIRKATTLKEKESEFPYGKSRQETSAKDGPDETRVNLQERAVTPKPASPTL